MSLMVNIDAVREYFKAHKKSLPPTPKSTMELNRTKQVRDQMGAFPNYFGGRAPNQH